jgi:hypothetical protein
MLHPKQPGRLAARLLADDPARLAARLFEFGTLTITQILKAITCTIPTKQTAPIAEIVGTQCTATLRVTHLSSIHTPNRDTYGPALDTPYTKGGICQHWAKIPSAARELRFCSRT